MSTISCLNLIPELNKAIDRVNFELIDNMTTTHPHSHNSWHWVCVDPTTSYDFYYQTLRNEWNTIINNFINQPDKCVDKLSYLRDMYQTFTPENLSRAKNMMNSIQMANSFDTKSTFSISDIDIENIVLDRVSDSILRYNDSQNNNFDLSESYSESIMSLSKIMLDHCQCKIMDIYKVFISHYKKIYFIKFEGKNKSEIITALRDDYRNFKEMLTDLGDNTSDNNLGSIKKDLVDKIASKLTGLYSFTLESELERLIPAELGSLKQFFIKVISKYYNNLHPIVWAQIFKNLTENLFIDLPYTSDDIFSFVSKQLLLNSGPFILKILQMIRPVLTPELAKKYNLTKLTYPVLKQNEVNLILQKVVYEWYMYRILQNFSASVGHVSKVIQANNPNKPFIIKIIKPLAVAQSCWEYKTLYNLYPEGTCEKKFIISMMESNGSELNVNNEIDNINKGYEYYTGTYNEIFDYDIDAKVTTIQNIPGLIHPKCWFALTMTLAPGLPLSKLIENDLLKEDTLYRANLHRCLDLLVYKFFHNIIKNGYYHGDLHSGNIFYSYDEKQLTLIDFGAVGNIDIYTNDSDMKILLSIVIMSIYHNYEEMLDVMTHLLNGRCVETQIDTNAAGYIQLKRELCQHRIDNIINSEVEKKKSESYLKALFSKERINQEKGYSPESNSNSNSKSNSKSKSNLKSKTNNNHYNINKQPKISIADSIYKYLEMQTPVAETIVENKDSLPIFTEVVGNSKNISFAGVLEKIIKYYALSGVNVAIKFNEFYEFQKAYALLLGVLHKVGYSSYRSSMATKKAIVMYQNLDKLTHVGTAVNIISEYQKQKGIYNDIKKRIRKGYTQCELLTNENIMSAQKADHQFSQNVQNAQNVQNVQNVQKVQNSKLINNSNSRSQSNFQPIPQSNFPQSNLPQSQFPLDSFVTKK